MADIQVSTQSDNPPSVEKRNLELTDLNRLQFEFIAHQACGGVYVDDDGKTGRMSVDELATKLGVTRDALYKAKYLIDPDDWDRLKKQIQKKIWSDNRVIKVWNGIFGRAAKGDYQQALLFLVNHSKDKIIIPAQKIEQEVGDNLADLLLLAQKRAREQNLPADNIIEIQNATDANQSQS